MTYVIRKALVGLLATCALAAGTPPAHAAEESVPLHEAVGRLTVAAEDRTGYNRESSFGGWTDEDHDGCNTRKEVLLEEALDAPEVTGRCTLSGGGWYSWYDGAYVTSASALDIDHLVPLAEAWDSGASRWTKAKRVRYANYLSDPRHLVAVTAKYNRQKADQDPTTWMPLLESAACRYVSDWLSVKLAWGLDVDPAERDALGEIAAGCLNEPVSYSPVD